MTGHRGRLTAHLTPLGCVFNVPPQPNRVRTVRVERTCSQYGALDGVPWHMPKPKPPSASTMENAQTFPVGRPAAADTTAVSCRSIPYGLTTMMTVTAPAATNSHTNTRQTRSINGD